VPYIKRIADGGFEQMVAPSVGNTNELYPDLNVSLANINRFVSDGKAAHVLGMFETVWHDDGETLFEATWYPLLYGAASAWEQKPVGGARFAADFPWTFFGVDDKRYSDDIADLAAARRLLHAGSDRVFWRDAFAPDFLTGELAGVNFSAIRLAAEKAIEHVRMAPSSPLHANAAHVMQLAARRYDVLGRDAQIAEETRGYYDDARAHVDGKHDDIVYRSLFTAKYLLWEQRDMFLELAPLVRSAWEYEDRPSHELSVLERYHMAAQRAIERADAIDRATYEGYRRANKLPPFDEALLH
jgi:hexosaminidase